MKRHGQTPTVHCLGQEVNLKRLYDSNSFLGKAVLHKQWKRCLWLAEGGMNWHGTDNFCRILEYQIHAITPMSKSTEQILSTMDSGDNVTVGFTGCNQYTPWCRMLIVWESAFLCRGKYMGALQFLLSFAVSLNLSKFLSDSV